MSDITLTQRDARVLLAHLDVAHRLQGTEPDDEDREVAKKLMQVRDRPGFRTVQISGEAIKALREAELWPSSPISVLTLVIRDLADVLKEG
jgi:hypothetical protein